MADEVDTQSGIGDQHAAQVKPLKRRMLAGSIEPISGRAHRAGRLPVEPAARGRRAGVHLVAEAGGRRWVSATRVGTQVRRVSGLHAIGLTIWT